MLKGFGLIFAIVFMAMGASGFIPPLMRSQLLFNVFEVSAVLNMMYILTGLLALSASTAPVYAKLYFKMVGLMYALLAIFGFALNGKLGFVQVNLADSFFHLIVAMIALYLGFTSKAIRNAQGGLRYGR
jgi:hypothetical protein